MLDIGQLIEQLSFEEKISFLAGQDLWHTVGLDQLAISSIRVSDGPNGVRGAFGNIESTSACTPVGIALGATWNPDLARDIGMLLGEEAKTKDVQLVLGPTVNIHRSPLAGRNFECYSEDPFLSGEMAAAYITGIQSVGVGACIKHFVCNDQETDRFNVSVNIDRRTLHEIYLEPFRKAIKAASPWAVMTAYNRVNGVHASENHYLLNSVLRTEWGYDGLILSDWFGTYSGRIIDGELDLEMPGPSRWMQTEQVQAAIEAGRIDIEHINSKVKRILSLAQRSGILAHSDVHAERSVDSLDHRKIIRQAGQEAIVLLKNDSVLPIDLNRIHSIAVIGENAYYPQILGGGSSSVAPHYIVSPLEGIRIRVGEQTQVDYAPGCFIHKSLPNPAIDTLITREGAEGLSMAFFDNAELAGTPAYQLTTKRVHFGWFDRSVPKVSQDRFSVRLSGYFVPKVSGKHIFGLNLVGWGRLEIAHKEIINTWDLSSPEGEWTKEVDLQAGEKYPIKIEYKWQGDTKWRMLSFGHLPPHSNDLLGEAIEIAAKADLAIVVAGLTNEWEAEGFDRPNMRLPGDQDDLIDKIASVNPRTVVVLNCGSPVEMPWLDHVAGVLQMWYDGQEQGNALADILFGDVSPSGKLPITFPSKCEDNPSFGNFPGKNGKVIYQEGLEVGYRYYGSMGITPLFHFGYGLSYTSFDLFDLKIEYPQIGRGELSVSVKVKNSGEYPGKEVVQLYVRELSQDSMSSMKQLRAFRKVLVAPQETVPLEFKLDAEAFWHYDVNAEGWTVDSGTYAIIIGTSSVDERLVNKITISDDLFSV
ncbi:glycoside hydrolase family 3 C-terminal domain-containing protein [Chloroflexota bacterium]|nr:glycoside hydrolase family 3 C-terminal domain-containing protein [Chloroflexota bacterium]